jgi:hypothetical protein
MPVPLPGRCPPKKIGVDPQDAVEAKMAKNKLRTYRRLPTGALVKDDHH